MKEKIKNLWELYSVMFKVGAVTFGGGYAMLPILEREFVDKRKWTTEEELMDWYAISQVTPGIIAVNVATFLGNKRRGVPGGIIATLGLVTPSLIIITLIAMFINNFAQIVWVQKALKGINVAVAAVLTQAAFKFGKKAVKNLLGFVLLIISFVLIFFFKVNTIWIILGSALIGVVLAGCRGEYKKVDSATPVEDDACTAAPETAAVDEKACASSEIATVDEKACASSEIAADDDTVAHEEASHD